MAEPFINWVLLRLIETAATSGRLAHTKYQQGFNAIDIRKPQRHFNTCNHCCAKMFIYTELSGNADSQHPSIFEHKYRKLPQLKELLDLVTVPGDIYKGFSVTSKKK